ncbi:MAG TPA: cyclic nucleotide-binding domain-containing protein [Spirochaetia bacterium]|nr:cyclic nucleotide-binding domain-containing protein [Spirochaetia bacterium]
MSVIGVINSDKALNELILKQLSGDGSSADTITIHDDTSDILEFLNYDISEIVIINLSDKNFDVETVINQIIADNWLHNFGIIGIYDKKSESEKKLSEKLKKTNLLNLFDFSKIPATLLKTVQIIKSNSQVIFQREISTTLVEKLSGSFELDNDLLSVPSYTNLLSIALFNKGYIDAEMKLNLNIALSELLVNAVEHGNCKITYAEKQAFIERGGTIHDLIEERCRDPEVSRKRVILEYDIQHDHSVFKVRDDGDGFNVQKYHEWLQKKDRFSLHGRGILMARSLSKRLTYNGKGNEATLSIEHRDVPFASPLGFSDEPPVIFQKGDIVFTEGEESTHIYYVLHGRFSVFHRHKNIGFITPSDVFLGEMSFLLNNKRSATVRAEKESKLIKISKKAFISVIKKYPHYGVFLSRLIAKKLARTNTQTARMMIKLSEYA